jgi:D-sedoheptulose 7-phosphate isomerase
METTAIELVRQELENTIAVYREFQQQPALIESVAALGELCAAALQRGNKIMLAGNGGSAADSQHIAAEFVSRLARDRQPLPAMALTTDTSILTAAANDYGYEMVFARQVMALGREGDVFIGISTSGRSPNILRALRAAREKGMAAAGLTGASGGEMPELCDLLIPVPSSRTQNIQELHGMIGHTIVAIAERSFLVA